MARRPEQPDKSLQEVVDELRLYPIQAFQFVQSGLQHTVTKVHGERPPPGANLHVSGQQLCEGLRELALNQWGRMARAVLTKWNLTGTADFGRIVFTLVDAGFLGKTDDDGPDDFADVYDFRTAFETGYRIAAEEVNA